MSKAAKSHMDRVASTGCVICREYEGQHNPGHVHHIADGSNPRSDFMTACLCESHHTGGVGVHGMGVKQFCRLFRLPNEYYLLELQNKFIAEDARK